MFLFIGLLAFPESQFLQDEAKLGVLLGSVLPAVAATLVLLGSKSRAPKQAASEYRP